MPISLRPNKAHLIDKILKKEQSLLRNESTDYFKSFYNKDVQETKEASDDGVSDYKTESEESDSFDSDFAKSEESVSNDSDDKSGKDAKLKFFRAKKSKRDKYFKKGFDIVNFNFESLAQPKVDDKAQKKTKKRKAYVAVKERHHFIHELYPQTTLLKNALNIERYCLMLTDHYNKLKEHGGEQEEIKNNRSTCDMKVVNTFDNTEHRPVSKLYFKTDEDYNHYFKEFRGKRKPSKAVIKETKSRTVQDYVLAKRQEQEKSIEKDKQLQTDIKETIKNITMKKIKIK